MKASVEVDYIMGHLRTGHYECEIPEEEKLEFLALSLEEKLYYIKFNGNLILDEYEIDDIGDCLPSTLEYESQEA